MSGRLRTIRTEIPLPYRDAYGLQYAHTVYRGTLRLMGWCETLKAISDLGWLDESPKRNGCGTYGDLTRHLIRADKQSELAQAVSGHLGLKTAASAFKRIEWLGLFGDTPLPEGVDSPLDCLHELTSRKLTLPVNERDMIVMHHEFMIQYDDRQELMTSTLVDYGVPNEDTAVARTVAYPAAIASRLVANGDIKMTGVRIPVHEEIYVPIMDELQKDYGITFDERTLPV